VNLSSTNLQKLSKRRVQILTVLSIGLRSYCSHWFYMHGFDKKNMVKERNGIQVLAHAQANTFS
jgi:hypothetical protein